MWNAPKRKAGLESRLTWGFAFWWFVPSWICLTKWRKCRLEVLARFCNFSCLRRCQDMCFNRNLGETHRLFYFPLDMPRLTTALLNPPCDITYAQWNSRMDISGKKGLKIDHLRNLFLCEYVYHCRSRNNVF